MHSQTGEGRERGGVVPKGKHYTHTHRHTHVDTNKVHTKNAKVNLQLRNGRRQFKLKK